MKATGWSAPPCDCYARLEAFAAREDRAARTLDIGTNVDCDCGLPYRLLYDRQAGPYWQRLTRIWV